MISSELQPHSPPIPLEAEQIRANMNRVARRQWWLWSAGMMVSLLLTLGIASFAFPGLLSDNESLDSFRLNLAVRGLVGLVLLFNVYTVYQQVLIHRLQRKVSDQVEALGKIEVRTEEVYNLAVLDSLTGLNNRRSGEQRLADEMSRAQRHGRPLTILLLDLDGLKSLNDKFGHAAGDELIRQFAARLKKAIRGSDLAVRLGGDEFLVLLPDCQPDEVRHVLGRLTGVNVDCKGQLIALSFSAGWAYLNPGESPEDIMKRADDALYANKRAGRVRAEVEALSS